MTSDEFLSDRFLALVSEILQVPANEISSDLGPRFCGRWTSLAHIELVAAVENEYSIRFSPREIRTSVTIGALHDILAAKGVIA